ncbi:trifunctional hydroxymethylpyrimidine kinase/phosphomethylpyrimidine kinase/thiaminase [Cryptotrichosporon argae]
MASSAQVARRQPHVLTIAGSDSGGGAGIQADIKTIAAFGCYGSTVLTALTAQNTLGVQAVHEVPADFVIQQLESIFADDLVPDAIKFGMLATEPIISSLSTFLASLPSTSRARPYLVLDPVMISTSGHTLLPASAVAALRAGLLPLVDLATPNIPEAVALAGWDAPVRTVDDLVALGNTVRDRCGVRTVLVKGGHMPVSRQHLADAIAARSDYVVHANEGNGDDEKQGDVIVDVLVREDGVALFVGPKVESTSTHGTGCTLSAALASCYALDHADGATGLSDESVRRAIEYTQGAIAAAFPLGRGHGPLNHGHMTVMRDRAAR